MTKEIWISAQQARELISANSNHQIKDQYVRELAQKGKIAYRPVNGRENEYLRRDVERIKVQSYGKKKVQSPTAGDQPSQLQTPIAQEPTSVHAEQKPIPAMSKIEQPPLPFSAPNRDILPKRPPDTITRGEFAKAYKVDNAQLGNWLKDGIEGDMLEVTWYEFSAGIAACFTPSQVAHNLIVLKHHGKLK